LGTLLAALRLLLRWLLLLSCAFLLLRRALWRFLLLLRGAFRRPLFLSRWLLGGALWRLLLRLWRWLLLLRRWLRGLLVRGRGFGRRCSLRDHQRVRSPQRLSE
jgi:hypothetical protein